MKYFYQRLLNYTQMFTSDSDYIFHALSMTQKLKLNCENNVAIRKVGTCTVTAGSFAATFQPFFGKDDA